MKRLFRTKFRSSFYFPILLVVVILLVSLNKSAAKTDFASRSVNVGRGRIDYAVAIHNWTSATALSTINFGETASGSISAPAETDSYTFTASTGDAILIGMSRVSGDLWQRIRLYDPGSNLLKDESSPVHVEITQTLSADGTYTILVSDGFNGTYTGDYNIYLQRLNDPADARPASFGQTASGTLAIPAEMDTYTFIANGGDTILIGMSRVSGNLWQRIRLYDPDGKLLNDGSSSVHTEITQTLPVAGTYTVLISDGFNGTYTGDYNIYLQRLNDPADARPASFGQTASGTIAVPVEMDTFTFTANAGDTILIGMSRGSGNCLFLPLVLSNRSAASVDDTILSEMSRVSGDLWQRIRLYDPDGNLLNDGSSPVHVEVTQTLPVAGVYTILVSDGFNGTYVGDYSLYLQRLNNPANVTSLSFGQTVPGTIVIPAEMDTYTFAANGGDTILIGMSRVSGNLWQRIRLYDPDGKLLNDESGPIHAEITQALSVAGTYAILVSDGFNGTYRGHYTLNLQKLP